MQKNSDRKHEKEMHDREWNRRDQADQRQRDWQSGESERDRDWRSSESNRDRDWRTGERQDQNSWQSGEREANQWWQTGEREAGQEWRTGERNSQNQWQSAENEKQGVRNIQRDYLQSLFAKDRMAYSMQLMGYATPGASFGGNQAGGKGAPAFSTSKGTQFPSSSTGDLMGNFMSTSTQTSGGRVLKNSSTPNQSDYGQNVGTQTSFGSSTVGTQTPAGNMVNTASLAKQTPKAGLGKRISQGFQAGGGRGMASTASEAVGGPMGLIAQEAFAHKGRAPIKPAGHMLGSMFVG